MAGRERFVMCVGKEGNEGSLIPWKVYRALSDPDAEPAAKRRLPRPGGPGGRRRG